MSDYQALISFLKEQDIETCINSLFVLTNSCDDIIESLMTRLQISRRELIRMMGIVLQRNIEEYQECMKLFNKSFEIMKPISDITDASNRTIN